MEQERIQKEKEEEEKRAKELKLKETFDDGKSQWEMDKAQMKNLEIKHNKEAAAKAAGAGTAAKAGGQAGGARIAGQGAAAKAAVAVEGGGVAANNKVN
jgi:mannan polymerase II complex ANP1 subunit